MNPTTLAAALVGFLLGGLTVSVAAELEDNGQSSPHGAAYLAEQMASPGHS